MRNKVELEPVGATCLRPRIDRLVALSLAWVGALLMTPVVGASQVLPLIVDETGAEPCGWWVGSEPEPCGPLDQIIEQKASTGVWISPTQQRPSENVSQVLRTVQLTSANARSLAGFYSADAVVFGSTFREDSVHIPWLALERSAFVFEGEVVDVSSGATRTRIDTRAVAFGPTHEAANLAAAELLLRFIEEALTEVAAPSFDAGVVMDEPVIVVLSDGSAAPFVAFRAAVRTAVPDVEDLREVWAMEGRVALGLVLREGADIDDVLARIGAMEGSRYEGVFIQSTVRHERDVLVMVRDDGLSE